MRHISSKQYLHQPLSLVFTNGSNIPQNVKLTLIRLALLSQFPCGFDSVFTAVFLEVIVCHDFTANKFVLKVRAE